MAYPVSWRRVTHLQRSWRWGNASRFESSRAAILNDKSLRNRVYVRFRRLFCFSHRTCDPSSKWAVRGTAKLRQTAGKPGHAHARRVARSAEHLGGRRRSAVGGRRPAGGGRRAASRLFEDSVSRDCCRALGRLLSHFFFKVGFIFKSTRTNITKLTSTQQCPCHSDVSQLGSGAGQSESQA